MSSSARWVGVFDSLRRWRGEGRVSVDDALEEIGRIASSSLSIDEVCDRLVKPVSQLVPFARLNVGYVDLQKGTFTDAYVTGLEVPGRQPGDVRPLTGTVAEAAITAGSGVRVAENLPSSLLSRFPRLQPLLDTGVRSMIAVPLAPGDRVVGVLLLANVEPDAYSERHLDLARRIAARMAGPIDNFKRYADLQSRADHLALLADVGRLASSFIEISDLCERLAEPVRGLVPFNRLELATLDLEAGTGEEISVTGVEIAGWEAERTFVIAGTPTQTVVETRSGVLRGGDSPGPATARYPSEAPALSAGLRSMMTMPLLSGDDLVGTLTFRSSVPESYAERDLVLAGQIAQHFTAAAASRAAQSRAEDQGRQQLEESKALAEIERLLGSAADIDDVYEDVARQVRRLLPFDTLLLGLFDRQEDRFSIARVSGTTIPDWGVGVTFGAGNEAHKALVNGQPGVAASADSPEALAEKLPHWPFIPAGGFRSIAATPLVSSNEVIAILLACSATTDAYEERHLALARHIRSLMAGTVAASRLRARLRQEAEEEETLGRIRAVIAGAVSMDDAFDSVAAELRGLLPFDRLAVLTVDPENATTTVAHVSGGEVPDREAGTVQPLAGTLVDEATRTRTPLIVKASTRDEAESRFPSLASSFEAGPRSHLIAPLVSNGNVVGAMVLGSKELDVYADRQLVLAERVSFALAGAVATAQLHADQAAVLSKQAALAEIARIMASTADMGDSYSLLAEHVRGLIPFDRMEIALINADAGSMTRTYVTGTEVSGWEEETTEPLAGTIVEEAVLSRAPFYTQAQAQDEVESRLPKLKSGLQAGLESYLVMPLVSNDEVVGAITLSAARADAYTDEHAALAERVASLLAGAVATDRIRKSNPPTSGEVAALAEIGTIVTSSLDIGEVYGRFAERVRELVPFDILTLWTVDLQRKNLIASYVWGDDVPGLERGLAFPLSVETGLQGGKAGPGDGEGRQPPTTLEGRFRDLLGQGAAGLPTMLLVPLAQDNETVGMLSFRSSTADSYAARDVAVAERIGAQITGAVANAQVYMECKWVEEAVRDAVERLDLAVQGSGDGLWDWKIPENEAWWSPRYKELLGFDEAKQDGVPEPWQARLHPEDRSWVLEKLSAHMEGKAPYHIEYRLRTDSGGYRWFNDRGQAIRDENGKTIRMSGSIRDVTEAREAGSSGPHDPAVPLAGIEGFQRALLTDRPRGAEAEDSEYDEAMASARLTLAGLMDDLGKLSWAMDEELRPEAVDLSAIARSVVRKLRRTRSKRGITFSIPPGIVVDGDPRLLRVAMENLLDNAWKYTGKRRRARVEFRATEQDGEKVYYVRDDGAGFDMAEADRLFGLFQRLHPASEFEGTGVSLATVRQIVARHGGRVWAEGQVKGGATFYFTL